MSDLQDVDDMATKQGSDLTGTRLHLASLKNWGEPPAPHNDDDVKENVTVDCGWGRLIFGQTFTSAEALAEMVQEEGPNRRDVAFYVREPHVVLATAPQVLFLDPSHTFRLGLSSDIAAETPVDGIRIRPAEPGDEKKVNRLYRAWSMVPVGESFFSRIQNDPSLRVLVAEDRPEDGGADEVVGVVMGVDHTQAFNDPDNGSSLWALAVDPQAKNPGIGRALVMHLAELFKQTGRSFMDLSVMHDNKEAISLYRKLGFEQIPVYTIKRKNPINEKLFVGPTEESGLNVYARIIVNEAKRRGILVEIEDAEAGLFRLTYGGRSLACREALSELTTAVAMSRCDDKAVTRRLLKKAGLRAPDQISVAADGANAIAFLEKHGRVVVKPASGEQGHGVAVDLTTEEEVRQAIAQARAMCDHVIMEEFVKGQDLRIIVIDEEVVAAAVRRPPAIRGDGEHTIEELIVKLSRRRRNATDGESGIPMDEETERCVRLAGYAMTDILPQDETLAVRKTANLHTGGTIHDVTDELHLSLRSAAIEAARVLDIPVVGFDFMVTDPAQPGYAIIEANERPGLANHEPQPTAEKFIDLLFPQTRSTSAKAGTRAFTEK
jgi:GNAT-family acetyltransferase (TIGR03103 family)